MDARIDHYIGCPDGPVWVGSYPLDPTGPGAGPGHIPEGEWKVWVGSWLAEPAPTGWMPVTGGVRMGRDVVVSAVIRWEDPPPFVRPGRGRTPSLADWPRVAEELREHAGRWALVLLCATGTSARQAACNIRTGATMRSRGPFDAVARTIDGEYRVYARYVGGEANG